MDADAARKYGNILERSSWILIFLSMLTQVSSEYSFPSYNIAIAFWGCYCAFSKHGRATFGYIAFIFVSLILDIIYCSTNGPGSSTYVFCLVMFIFCMFTKCFSLYIASHFFAAIGGAFSMESSMTGSAYDSLGK